MAKTASVSKIEQNTMMKQAESDLSALSLKSSLFESVW